MENLEGGTLSLEHRYRVERRQGRHALTTRYRGLQLPFERPVWIKVYDPLADAGPDRRVFDRIKQSAHQAHRIDAPTVLRSLDYGELDKGIPFVVSERISGPSLSDYLDEHGPLPPTDAVDLTETLGDALAAAHELGLAHGTLDPRWIFVEDDDPAQVVVDHFAVGLALDELRRIDGAVMTPELLRPYPPETFERDTIPPEEVADDHDPTAEFTVEGDVYALGCVLYESLVGFHPYFEDGGSTDASEGIVQVQTGEPRPLEELGVDPELSELVLRAIARDPSERFSSTREFTDALLSTRAESKSASISGTTTAQPLEEQPDDQKRDPRATEGPPVEPPPADESEKLEPGGPSSVLVTVAIGVLLASNIGWFFLYMNKRSEAKESKTRQGPAGPVETFRVHSTPDGAAVYVPGREKPIGRTPVDIPADIVGSGKFQLQLKKTGFTDTTLSVRRDEKRRTVSVDLTKETER